MANLQSSPMSGIFKQILCSAAKGNVVKLIIRSGADADPDLGIAGTVTETTRTISPEPFINSIPVKSVSQSGGAFRYSDFVMSLSKDSITNNEAYDPHTEFLINGDRFKIQSVQNGPTAWEFVIREEKAEPVAP
jgi:hypothetical protein